MTRWSVVLVLSVVGIAIWGIPPERFVIDREWAVHRTPERQAFVDLYQEIMREGWKYQRTRWRDSLSERLLEDWALGEPFAIGLPTEAPDSVRDRLEAGMRLHLERLGAQAPVVPVGAYLVDRTHSAHPAGPDRSPRTWWAREYFVGRDRNRPFCFVVQPVNGSTPKELARSLGSLVHIPPDSVSDPNTLRLCGFYARFGQPGCSIRTWLGKGGHQFGVGARNDPLPPGSGPVRGPLGVSYGGGYYSRQVSPRAMACLGGAQSACRAVFLAPDGASFPVASDDLELTRYRRNSPVDFLELRYQMRDFGGWEAFLLEDLVAEFGADRFRRFWTHSGTVEKAFERSFGQPVGPWMSHWALERFGTIDRGPRVPVSATLFSLLTLGILAGGAVYVGKR